MKLEKIRVLCRPMILLTVFLSVSLVDAQQSPEGFSCPTCQQCPACLCPPPMDCPPAAPCNTPSVVNCPQVTPCGTPNGNGNCSAPNCSTDAALRAYVQANISSCLVCDQAVLDLAATCAPNGGCLKKCDASKGEYLWVPTCECLTKAVLCDKLDDAQVAGGEGVALVNTNWYHPETQANYQFQVPTFQQVTNGGGSNSFGTAADLASHSACLAKVRQTCVDMGWTGVSWTEGLTSARFGDEADECMLAALNTASRSMDLKNKAGSATTGTGYMMDITNRAITVDITKFTASGYLNTDCTPAEQWKVDLITKANCPVRQYNFNMVSTPISLLWGDGIDIMGITARTKFPLNPDLTGKWFEWRASGYSPLIVWDPEGKGIITDASQLFGGFTWNKTWANGYEPLVTLDADNNGWLEEAELKSIALWFDFNQDGVSDKDEVKSLQSVGVEAIGVKHNGAADGNRNLFADQGYKRVKDNKTVIGRSVDWSVGYKDARLGAEALSKDAIVPLPKEVLARRASREAGADLNGFWDWQVVAKDEFPQNLPAGMMRIRQDGNRVEGYTVSSRSIAPNGAGVGSKVTMKAFKGDTHVDSEGTLSFRFETLGSEDSPIYTLAGMTSDGTTLKGLSKEKLPNGTWVEYAWVARRYQP